MNTNQNLGNLRWHYPDQVIRVFLSLHAEGHPESSVNTFTAARVGQTDEGGKGGEAVVLSACKITNEINVQ